ncbi:SDR family oxidoreductase [Rhizobium sp. RCAM05350]|nr:SDR family oxidoreductase [Rhizobium sp. RCAM05350]
MLLKDKTAIIHGAAGHLGRSIATTFAREGAKLFLAGRTFEPVLTLMKSLDADAAQVDALDEMSAEEHAERVIDLAGRIDIGVNAVSIRGDLQGQPLIDMSVDDVLAPAETGIRTNFVTARCCMQDDSQPRWCHPDAVFDICGPFRSGPRLPPDGRI